MNTRHLLLPVVLLSMLAAPAARAARDPFWPIGYTPPPPPGQAEPEPQEAKPLAPPPPPAPAEKPISDAEWTKARKALAISGIAKSVRPDTKETRILLMINRRSYAAGDTVTFVNDDIRFQWRIDALTERDYTLTPLTATRVVPKPNPLSTNQ